MNEGMKTNATSPTEDAIALLRQAEEHRELARQAAIVRLEQIETEAKALRAIIGRRRSAKSATPRTTKREKKDADRAAATA